MKYILESQIKTYLKLKKSLAAFCKIDKYFEFTTFNWFYLSGTPSECTVRLYKSYDEGNEFYCDVMGFSTVNEDDEIEDEFLTGHLDDCLEWLESKGGNKHKIFHSSMIDQLYENWKKENI